MEIDIQRVCAGECAPDDAQLRALVDAVVERFGRRGDVTLRLVDEAESQALNKLYRQQDKPTNVLSFALSAPEQTDVQLLGDIVICAPLVAREAREQGKSPAAHWAHIVVHGVLHLLGFDHEQDEQALEMENHEREILNHFDVPDPYRLDGDNSHNRMTSHV